ncbi:HD-GYP domain-containing protein [Shewanella sp. Isolate11]|uniref:HD domain-containing phosphohydrolase n=1 Tax=Shewanella sp. Isolate11 TaxID=2908530 RepID=UPI001EFCB526|nr:DUF3391 domain-containing protein [Shewanella sp. Isolate11]
MAKTEPLTIPIAKLQIGQTVKLPLSWKNHPFLRNRIKIDQEEQIELIKSLNVPFVILLEGDYVADDESDQDDSHESHKAVPKPDLVMAARQSLRKSLRYSQKRFNDSVEQNRTIFSKIASDPSGAYREGSSLTEALLEHLYEETQPHFALVSAGRAEQNEIQHGITVAVIALSLAKALDLSKVAMRDIALGCLFHDIGKLKVPESIKRKKLPLTTSETNFLKMHPNFGHEMLAKTELYSPEVLDIVLHHHEFVDGSGYPHGLTEAALSLNTQLVSLANDYMDLISVGEGRSPQIALGYLFKNHRQKHAESLIAALVKALGIYPPGTIVKLSDGSIAKVMRTTSSAKRPNVWACDVDGAEPSLRVLENESVEVVESVKLDELDESVSRILKVQEGICFYFC